MISQIESEPVRSPVGLPGFDESEGILPSPRSLFKLFHAPALGFLAGFLSSLTLSQLSHCPSLSFQAQGHFSQKKLHCLQANQVSELFTRCSFLLNTKLHFQQYITAIVQVGLQRIF